MPRERIRRKKKATKDWYSVLATHMFGKAKIAETTADDPVKLMGRTVEVSMQELTNDFSKSHIKLKFKIVSTKGMEAHTVFAGHALTTDYVKRMSRKHKSKVDGVFDVLTRDGVLLRVKPEAMAGRRIQHSQKRAIRGIIKETVEQAAQTHDFDEFIQFMLNGDLGKEAYHHCKTIYPIKRVEVHKSEILELPKVKAVTEAREEAALAAVAADEESPEAEIDEVEAEQPPEPTASEESGEDISDGEELPVTEGDQDEETAVDAETDEAPDSPKEDPAEETPVETEPDLPNDEKEAATEPEKSDDSKD